METLYNGEYIWSIFNSKNADGTYNIVTRHGVTGGKMVEHISLVKEGKNKGKKNETTVEQQADLEVQRECVKKKKQGYHLKNEVNVIIKPMLAQEYKQQNVTPAWVQPKLDGVRCLVYLENGEVVFQSRQNTIYDPILHLVGELRAILERAPDIVLDGELYAHELGFENIISMVRRAKVKHPGIHNIKYHMYDLFYKDTSMYFIDRHQLLTKIYDGEPNVVVVETIPVKKSDIETLLHKYIAANYEGIMIRGNGVYKHGRSKDLLKYKLFQDDEFEVVGHHEGQGGIPIFECKIKDKTFSVAMKGTTESKKERMENVEEFYGKLLTVKYQELSADGIPRFPVGIAFRDYET
jgi:DNA ligase-1